MNGSDGSLNHGTRDTGVMRIGRQLPSHRVLVVAGAAVASIVLIYAMLSWWSGEWWRDRSFGRKGDGIHWRLSVATASTALLLMATALSIGPIRRLRYGREGPVHLPWRRTVGVAAAIVGWCHAALGLTIHSAGWRLWGPFTYFGSSNRLMFIFSVAMSLGVLTAVALIPVAATSNSAQLQRLGGRRWKQVQRLSYGVFALLLAHVVGIQYQEKRDLLHISFTMSVIAAVVVLQGAGVAATRRRASTNHPHLSP